MQRITVGSIFIILALLLAACQSGGSLEVKDPWARPGAAAGNSAVYFQIDNQAGADKLVSATSAAAEVVELHETSMDMGGTMMMHPQEFVEIPAGQVISFEPGGLHVMLIGLTADLAPGDTITVLLTFEKAGEIELSVPIQEP